MLKTFFHNSKNQLTVIDKAKITQAWNFYVQVNKQKQIRTKFLEYMWTETEMRWKKSSFPHKGGYWLSSQWSQNHRWKK